MNYRYDLLEELKNLEQEHQELNKIIDDPESQKSFSEFTFQKLKRRKLLLKDKIRIYKTTLSPDIIA